MKRRSVEAGFNVSGWPKFGVLVKLNGPVRQVRDSFVDTLAYLQNENQFVEDVYRMNKDGQLTASSPEADRFIEGRMAEGSSMLRDLIYSAWIESASLRGPKRSAVVTIPVR